MILKLIPFKLRDDSLEVLASVSIDSKKLLLHYKLTPLNDVISIPDKIFKEREIGLWESTCFEFFLLEEESQSYYEFNFSPSGKWNCFYFKQQGDQLSETDCKVLTFSTKKSKEYFELTIEIDINSLNESFVEKNEFKMNLTAVLEEESLTYWALGHSIERPNFHDFELYRRIKKSGNKPKPVT